MSNSSTISSGYPQGLKDINKMKPTRKSSKILLRTIKISILYLSHLAILRCIPFIIIIWVVHTVPCQGSELLKKISVGCTPMGFSPKG